MKKMILALIKFYQILSRLILFPACRFYPSCSDYYIQAINRHGLFKGTALALFRLLRCNPLSEGGYDPVD